jgi:hypothetical protein
MAKRKTKVKQKEKIKECEGWSLGDYAWAVYVDGSVVEGEVVDFYPKDNHGPCASIMTQNRGHRTVLIENMRDQKIKRKDAINLRKK